LKSSDAKRAEVAKMGNLTPALKRYDQEYIKTVDGEPVPHDTLVAVIPAVWSEECAGGAVYDYAAWGE